MNQSLDIDRSMPRVLSLFVAMAVLLIIVVIAAIAFFIYAVNVSADIKVDAYAADYTAIFVIEHLNSTNGEWPGGWEDLRDEYETVEDPGHYAWTFDELQERVIVDWDVNVAELVAAEPPIEVIQLSSGRRGNTVGDPNERVRDYLISIQPVPTTTSQNKNDP